MRLLKKSSSDDHKLEPTALIDVTFLLLVFFLCTIRFKTLEGKLLGYLPKGAGPDVTVDQVVPPVEVRIMVAEPGRRVFASGSDRGQTWSDPGRRYDFAGRSLHYRIGPRQTSELHVLDGWMRELQAQDPQRRWSIDAGPRTIYGDVIPVFDALVEAGADEIGFVGEYRSKQFRATPVR